MNNPRLGAVQCLVSFINHKNTLKTVLPFISVLNIEGVQSSCSLVVEVKTREKSGPYWFCPSFCKMTYSLLSLCQPFVLFICNKLRASLSAKEDEFWGAGLLPLGFMGRKGLHRIYLLTPRQSRVRNFLFHLALHFISPCNIDVRQILRHCHI